MPELPEVEVVRRSLSNLITGLKITNVVIFNSNLRFKITKKKTSKIKKFLQLKDELNFCLLNLKIKR